MRRTLMMASLAVAVGCGSASSSGGGDPSGSGSDPAAGATAGGSGAAGGATASNGSAGSSGSGAGAHPATGGTSGPFDVRLVDAPNPDVSHVFVTIDHVDVEIDGAGSSTIVSTPQTLDLLALQNGVFASLGVSSLPTGHVTQLRLYVSADAPGTVVTPDGAEHALKIPGGQESGIKMVGGFDVDRCQSGNVTIDFDAAKSLELHAGGSSPAGAPADAGSGGHADAGATADAGGGSTADAWFLRPVIHLKSVHVKGGCGDAGDGGGASDDADGGADPCASVTCADGELCVDGACHVPE